MSFYTDFPKIYLHTGTIEDRPAAPDSKEHMYYAYNEGVVYGSDDTLAWVNTGSGGAITGGEAVGTGGQVYKTESGGKIQLRALVAPDSEFTFTNLTNTVQIAPRVFAGSQTGFVPSVGSQNGYFLRDDGTWAAAGGGVTNHNDLSAIDGGTTAEYYHLTAAEHTALLLWAAEDPADYSLVTHNHDANYADIAHTHDGLWGFNDSGSNPGDHLYQTAGWIAVGTNDPLAHVHIEDPDNPALRLYSSTYNVIATFGLDGALGRFDIGTLTSDDLVLRTSNTAQLTIDSGGDITIAENLTVDGILTAQEFEAGVSAGLVPDPSSVTGKVLYDDGWADPATDGVWTVSGSYRYVAGGISVGVGTATPSAFLHVQTSSGPGSTTHLEGYPMLRLTSETDVSGLKIVSKRMAAGTAKYSNGIRISWNPDTSTSAATWFDMGNESNSALDSQVFRWGINGSIANGNTELMRLDAAGRLAIGTSSHVGKLRVVTSGSGNDRYVFHGQNTDTGSGNAVAILGVFDNDAEYVRLLKFANEYTAVSGYAGIASLDTNSAEGLYIMANDSGGTIRFVVGGTSLSSDLAMIINSAAQVMINTTSASDQLHVGGIIRATGYRERSGTGGSYGTNAFNLNYVSGGNCELWIDSTNFGYITVTSDARTKQLIRNIPDTALSRILRLRSVLYRPNDIEMWKDDGVEREGFLAHEVQQIIPSAVNGEPDSLTSDGTIQPQTLNAFPVIAVLVKAVQELSSEVDQLKRKLQ